MGVTVYFWHCAIFAQLPRKKKAFSFKYSLKRTYKHKRLSHFAFYCEIKQMCGLFCFGAGKRSQDGLSQGFSDILPENCWSQKTRPMFQIWHVHIFLVQNLLSQGHTSQPPGQGAVWSRLSQMGKSPVAAAADGSSGGRSHRDPPSQTSLTCSSSGFWRPEQMVCKAFRLSSYRGLRQSWAS